MEKAKRARKAETLKQPSLPLRLRAPYFYPDQRLNLSQPREGPPKIRKGYNPDLGNLAVRHSREPTRKVRQGEIGTPSCNRKSGNGRPTPAAGHPRSLTQPWTMDRAKRAQKAETPKQP